MVKLLLPLRREHVKLNFFYYHVYGFCVEFHKIVEGRARMQREHKIRSIICLLDT